MIRWVQDIVRTIWFFFKFAIIIVAGYFLFLGLLRFLMHPAVTTLIEGSPTALDFWARLVTAVNIMGGLFLITWGLHFFDRYLFRGWLVKRGQIFSRGPFPLLTIFTFPFFHGDYGHLWGTTRFTILFAGLAVMFIPSLSLVLQVGIIMFLVQGIGVWIFGKKGKSHVGTSGLMLGLFSFDVLFGILELGWQTAVALLLLFFFGKNMYRTLMDRGPKTSVETHMWGFFSGLVIAYLVSPFGPLSIY